MPISATGLSLLIHTNSYVTVKLMPTSGVRVLEIPVICFLFVSPKNHQPPLISPKEEIGVRTSLKAAQTQVDENAV
jgi:hypothetical protein